VIKKFLHKIFPFVRRKRIYFLILLIVLYKSIFNVFTAGFFTSYFFKNYTTLHAQLEWKKFSLFFGIDIQNIQIQSDESFQKQSLFRAERLSLGYNLLYLLLFRLELDDIQLIHPEVQLIEKSGVWNFEKILRSPSPPKKDSTEPDSPPLELISIYIPAKAHLFLNLENLVLQIQRETNPLELSISGTTILLDIETHRTRTIPLNLELLKLPEKLSFQLNPSKNLQIQWKSKEYSLDDKFQVFLKLLKEDPNNPIYSSRMGILLDGLEPKSNTRKPKSIHLNFEYDIQYNKSEEKLLLNKLYLGFQKKDWISLVGMLEGNVNSNPKILLESQKFSLPMDELDLFLGSYPEVPKIGLGGNIIIPKFKASGVWDDLQTEIELKADRLFFQNHKIPYLQLDAACSLNLSNSNHMDKELKIPFVNEILVRSAKLGYNGADAELQFDSNRNQKTNLKLGLKNLLIDQFTKAVRGLIQAELTAQGETLSNLKANLKLIWNSFRFKLGVNDSIPSRLDGNLSAAISLGKNFIPKNISISSLVLGYMNPSGGRSVLLKANGNISSLSPFVLQANQLYLETNLSNLMGSLPYSFLDTIARTRNLLGNQLSLSSTLNLDTRNGTSIQGNLKPVLPGIYLLDPEIQLGVQINSDGLGSIKISQFQLKAFQSMLSANISGTLKKGLPNPTIGEFTPDLQVDVRMQSADMKKVTSSVFFKGDAGLSLKVQKSLATGKLFSDNTSLSLFFGTCPGELCKNYIITSMNISLPIEHDLTLKTTQSIIDADKSKFIKSYGTELPVNFTISRVTGSHPYYTDQPVVYIKENGDVPGFQGRFDYVKNIFTLDKLKINSLNGTIFGKNILFNLGGGDPAFMEFTSTLQIRELDLKELLPSRRAKNIDDGKIAADLNLSGRNFKDLIPNLNLYFSIFKIGKDFGNSVINIVSPPNLLRDFVIKSYSVDKIQVELSRGLVYANIDFKSSILSTIFTKVEDNRISQERMPLANFLNRAQEEISIYR
jgi:hypothetical protein